MGLRKLDAFAKTRPELQQKSVAGGIITAVAAVCAGLLFFAQIVSYIIGSTHHSLHLADSQSNPLSMLTDNPLQKLNRRGHIRFNMKITFPHLHCNQVDVSLDGAYLLAGDLEKVYGQHSITLKPATSKDASTAGFPYRKGMGCTVVGTLRPQIVSGVFTVGISRRAWVEATQRISIVQGEDSIQSQLKHLNVSHYVHSVKFGTSFPKAADYPLENHAHWINNNYGGIAVEHVQVKLIPTLFRTIFSKKLTYQMSVADHTINPTTLVTKGVPYLPGLVLSYDFTPLAVHHSEGRDNFLVFLSSLISIVGGVFVTVSLLTGCLVHSAQAVAKKVD